MQTLDRKDRDATVATAGEPPVPRVNLVVRTARKLVASPLRLGLLAVLVMLLLYPIYWIMHTAAVSEDGGLQLGEMFSTWKDGDNLRALFNSIRYGVITAGLSTLIAVPLAWIYQFSNLRVKWVIPFSAVVGFALPSYCLAISFMLLLGPRTGDLTQLLESTVGWSPNLVSFSGMVIVSVLHLWPMAFLIVSASMSQMDESLRDASRSVGSRSWRTTLRVELPLVRPAVFSGFILVYIYTLVLFSVPLLIGMPSGNLVLTTAIYREYSSAFPNLPAASALSLLFLMATIPAVLLSRWSSRRGRFTTVHTGDRRLVRLPLWGKVVGYLGVGIILTLSAWLPLGHFALLAFSKVWYAPSDGLTLDNFRSVFESPMFMRSLTNTLQYSIFTAALVTMIVALIAYTLRQRIGRATRAAFEIGTVAPYAIPGVVLAIGYILAFGPDPFGLVGTVLILVLAYTGHYIPVGYQALQPVYDQLDPDWDDAAKTSGAALFRRLRTVVLPLLTPGLVSSAVLVFISVAKELPLTLMLSSGRTLGLSALTIQVFEDGSFSRLGALGLILIVIVLVATGFARFIEARLIKGRRTKKQGVNA